MLQLVIIACSVQSYFLWDSFTSGVATSIMHKSRDPNGENDFAEMEFMNITVVTSNKPYGVSDGSNPFFDGLEIPKFNLKKGGVHSGHDGYTMEVTGPEAVSVLVATKAKPNRDRLNLVLHLRYTAENSVKFGAPRDTDHPELRQPLALEVWESVLKSLDSGSKITILANGPLTNLANIILSDKNTSSLIQDVYIVGGNINYNNTDKGNVFTIPLNEYAEFNMFLDPLAAKTVFHSGLDITLIPLGIQRKVCAFPKILERLHVTKRTPEAVFARRLISRLHRLQLEHHRYQHMDTFLGEILGAVTLGADHSTTNSAFQVKSIRVVATGAESVDGQMKIDKKDGKSVKILENVDDTAYYGAFANRLGDEQQSAVVGSFQEQRRTWSRPPK
ncbi:hypothetical protein C3L33_12812, partial [Rhododendron williamsianum]